MTGRADGIARDRKRLAVSTKAILAAPDADRVGGRAGVVVIKSLLQRWRIDFLALLRFNAPPSLTDPTVMVAACKCSLYILPRAVAERE